MNRKRRLLKVKLKGPKKQKVSTDLASTPIVKNFSTKNFSFDFKRRMPEKNPINLVNQV